MKCRYNLACLLDAFWPFTIALVLVIIWSLYSWVVPAYVLGEPQTWILLGRFMGFLILAAASVTGIAFLWVWCHDNYRKCLKEGEK